MQPLRRLGFFCTVVFLAFGVAGRAGAADFPKGTFSLKAPDETVWAIKFDGKGKYTVTRDGKELVEGTYKITKDEIEFTDVKGGSAEQGDKKTGTYKWKLAEKKLTFTKAKDEAQGRSTILTSGPWEMKE